MLCPEVWDFPAPKVIESCKVSENYDNVVQTYQMNNFYKSIVITVPDELQMPKDIEDLVTEDTDYYSISDCSLEEFIEPTFINSFVKNGKLFCLSANTDSIVQNCAAITPDGILTIHTTDFVFQTLGLEGTKRPHNFYEIKIDLLSIKHFEKLRQSLNKLEHFSFDVIWEPNDDKICPSSIAKYFYGQNINVSVHSLVLKSVTPEITEIPNPKDTEIDEMVEWIGMLAVGGELSPKEPYISSYTVPESETSLKSTRISLLIAKGFISPTLITKICEKLSSYTSIRELDNYWTSISVQSNENSIWQWNKSSPRMFQAHNSSTTAFFTQDGHIIHTVGQLKYS